MNRDGADRPTTHIASASDENRAGARRRRSRPIGGSAVAATIGAYAIWRLGWTLDSSALVIGAVVLGLELWSLAELASLRWVVRRGQRADPPAALEARRGRVVDLVERDVTIVVTCHGREVEELEHTLYSLAAEGRAPSCRVVVVDDRARAEVGRLAGRLGAVHLVRPGAETEGFRAATFAATTPLVFWLRAGDVTMPGALVGLAAHFADPAVAVVQSSVGLLNADSLVHLRGGRDEEAFEREVLGPALGRRGLAPWRGPASMCRVAPLVAAAALVGATASPDRWRLALAAGRCAVMHEERVFVRRRAADHLDDYLAERRCLAASRLGAATWRAARVSPAARVSTFALASLHLAGLRLAIAVAVLVTVLITAAPPVAGDVVAVATVAACLVAGAAASGRRALGAGTMALGDWTRQGWRALGADVAGLVDAVRARGPVAGFRRRSGVGRLRRLGRLRSLTAIVVVLDVALAVRAATIWWPDLLPRFESSTRLVVVGIAIVTLVPMLDVLQVVVRRRQRRSHHRLRVRLDVALDGTHAHTIDIGAGGVGIHATRAPEVGAEVAVTLLLEGPHSSALVDALCVVRHVRLLPDGDHHVGVEFVAMDEASRAALFRYCAIDHPGWVDRTVEPEPVVGPSDLAAEGPRARSLAGAASAAAVALGIATVVFGPTAAPALAEDVASAAVCVRDGAGGAVDGATAELREADAWVPVESAATEPGCFRAAVGRAAYRVWVDGRAAVVRVDPAVSSEVTVSLVASSVRVVDSAGVAVVGARVDRHGGGWFEVGVTDGEGRFVSEGLPGRVAYRVWVDGRRAVVRVDPAVSSEVTVSTVAVTPDLVPGLVAVHSGEWRGVAGSIELLPGRYRALLDDGSRPLITVEAPRDPTDDAAVATDATGSASAGSAGDEPASGGEDASAGGDDAAARGEDSAGRDDSAGSDDSAGDDGTVSREEGGVGGAGDATEPGEGSPTEVPSTGGETPPGVVDDPGAASGPDGDPDLGDGGSSTGEPSGSGFPLDEGWFDGGFSSGVADPAVDAPSLDDSVLDASAGDDPVRDAGDPNVDGFPFDDVRENDDLDENDDLESLRGAEPLDPGAGGPGDSTPGAAAPPTSGSGAADALGPAETGIGTEPGDRDTPDDTAADSDRRSPATGTGATGVDDPATAPPTAAATASSGDDDVAAGAAPAGVVVIVRPTTAADGAAVTAIDVDNTAAAPVVGPLVVDVPLDADSVEAVPGDGWTCRRSEGGLRCRHPGPLLPGPVTAVSVAGISTSPAADGSGTSEGPALLTGSVTVSAPGLAAGAVSSELVVDARSAGRGELVLGAALALVAATAVVVARRWARSS